MNNTLTRAVSGFFYIILLIGATYYSPKSFLLLFGLLLLFSVLEFCQLIKLNPILPLLFASSTYILLHITSTNKTNDILLLIITLIISVKCLLFLIKLKNKTLNQSSKYVFLIGYLIFPIIILTKIPFVNGNYNSSIIISIFSIIWTNDTFAYLVGKSFGKNKLFERVSPKKTIEGFIGGLIFSLLTGVLLAFFYIHENLIKWAIIAIITSLFGTLGDLIESKFKRNAKVKDSGNIMPGHGGFLDRLDSLIFASPFVYLFYQIIYYVS